jgi:hypothetical protein
VWDAEELLECSIASLRPAVSYVVVVWQQRSNFGKEAPNPFLQEFLEDLRQRGVIDELVQYTHRSFSTAEKTTLTSPAGFGLL